MTPEQLHASLDGRGFRLAADALSDAPDGPAPEPFPWPSWAKVTEIGTSRWRLDLDGDLNGTRLRGHVIGPVDTLQRLVAALLAWPRVMTPAQPYTALRRPVPPQQE